MPTPSLIAIACAQALSGSSTEVPEPPHERPPDSTPAESRAEAPPALRGFSVAPRLGFVLGGTGRFERSCEGDGCQTDNKRDASFSHETAIAVGIDGTFQVAHWFRAGLGIIYSPKTDLTPQDSNEARYGIGAATDISALAEGTFLVAPRLWLVPSVRAGLALISPGRDLEDDLAATAATCRESGTIDGCGGIEGTNLGASLGFGAGILYALNQRTRLRADALAEFYRHRLYSLHATGSDQELSLTVSGARVLLLLGLEL